MADDAKPMGLDYLRDMRTRLWPTIREFWFDALVVCAAIVGPLELAFARDAADAPDLPLAVSIPVEAGLTLLLLGRRWFPFAAPAGMLVAGAALSFWDARLVTFTFVSFVTAMAATFLLGLFENRRQALTGLAIAVCAVLMITWNDPDEGGSDLIFISLLFTTVWLLGFGLSRKLEQAREAEERARRLELEREAEARAAVAEERARIARELHDVVGHAVSVMTVQASGVRRLLKPDQEREREALEIVEQTGREALAEMRRLVGVLRRPEEAPALAPQPSLRHVDRLVEQAREAGLPIELRIEGEPTELPAGVDLTAYRLVQEALTNALKHAQATQAEVVVRYGDSHVELVVTDDGRGASDGSPESGGHGLVGMRERVSVYGGELEAGPRPGGGYELRAQLPLSYASARMTEPPSGTVTFLFSDIERSTVLLRRLRDRYGDVLAEHQRLLREAFQAEQGHEIDTQGDSFFVAFRKPKNAVLAALAGQRALHEHAWPEGGEVRVRMGIHTGEASFSENSYHGLAVHRAARICAVGHGGQVLVSQTSHTLLEDEEEELPGLTLLDLGRCRLKDFDRPIGIYQLVAEGLPTEFPPLRTKDDVAEPESADGRLSVLIADDQALVRAGFRMILEAEPDVDVVGEATNGDEAIRETRRLRPHIVLMDVRMPELDGIEATRRLLAEGGIPTKVVMLTTFDMDEYVYEALRAGASGFLLKDVPPEQLVAGIRAVASGDALLAPSITKRVIEEFVQRPPEALRPPPPELAELTERELEVLKQVARGLSNAEIAKELFVSETTVKTHVGHILTKLGLRDRVQAVVFAYESGLVARGGA
jgi:DNA-binding NarL/FixJ family response regulator/signal transduction histidine kinase/class 3 adenylate cyclase